jgi:hypothetical protein
VLDGLRQEKLATVPSQEQPRDAIERRREIVTTLVGRNLTRAQGLAYPQLTNCAPVFSEYGSLGIEGGDNCIQRGREGRLI